MRIRGRRTTRIEVPDQPADYWRARRDLPPHLGSRDGRSDSLGATMAKATRGRSGAASPQFQPSPAQDVMPSHEVRDPEKGRGPWGAYTLGHDTRMLPYYMAQFSKATNTGRLAFREIPSAADRIQVAVAGLSEVIPPDVLGMILHTWRSLRERAGLLEEEFIASWDFPDRDLATVELVAKASLLADQAIPHTLPVTRWFDLGCTVGELCQREHLSLDPFCTTFRRLAEAAGRINCSERDACQELRRVASLLNQPESSTEDGLRNLYVDRSAADWPHPDQGPWGNPALDDDDFGAAVATAQAEFDKHQPQVVVGSSRGGAIAMNIKSGDAWLVLLCPAWRNWGTARTVKADTVILHSRADDVIPFADSEELANISGATLIEVGNDHRLADPESLTAMLRACEKQ